MRSENVRKKGIVLCAVLALMLVIFCACSITPETEGERNNTTDEKTTTEDGAFEENNDEEFVTVYCLSRCEYQSGSSESLDDVLSMEVTYDNQWQCRNIEYCINGESLGYYYEFQYDNENRLSSEKYYTSNELWFHAEYFYDESGLLTAKRESNDGGLSYEESEYAYDKDGNCISEIVYRDGEKTSETTLEYDKNNQLINREQHFGDGEWFLEEYVYDERGNLLVEKYLQNYPEISSSGENHYKNTYDSNGLLTSVVITDEDREFVHSYEYTYDENGNIATEMICYEEGVVSEIRKYTYKAVEMSEKQASVYNNAFNYVEIPE